MLTESTNSEFNQHSTRMKHLFSAQQDAFLRAPMPTLQQRKQQLETLKATLIHHQYELAAAIDADFNGRSTDETLMGEILPCVQGINYTLKHLKRWMRPQKRSVGLHFLPASARVMYQPLGVVGIIVPYNYPVLLAIMPLVSALAAGNRAMLKLSELTPRTSALLESILASAFEAQQIAVVTGDAAIAAAFTRMPFDHLLFTGSTAIGRLVMREAAENLTPVTLELGGKSPAIIADDIPLQDIIQRLCFAKTFNAGQTCVAPDYVLLPRNKVEQFIALFKASFNSMFPGLNDNPDYTGLINAHTRQRLQDWLKDAADKGASIESLSPETATDGSFRMPLHLVTRVNDEMKIMQKELFGPILPLVPYDTIEEALEYVRKRPRPLAIYLFTYTRTLQEHVANTTHSGALCINEALIHAGMDDLPFGGIGQSGMGHYHGHEGFLTMSKAKAIMSKGRLNSMKFIYPPYGGLISTWLLKWLLR